MKKSATKTKATFSCTYQGCEKKYKTERGLHNHIEQHAQAHREELKRAAHLEFNIENKEQANEICAHLKMLETTVGWIYLKRFLEDSMKVIERQIITKKDIHTGDKLSNDEIDQLRMSYLAYEELAEKPSNLIANLSQGNRPTLPQYDPFARELKDSGTQYAGVLADDEVEDDNR